MPVLRFAKGVIIHEIKHVHTGISIHVLSLTWPHTQDGHNCNY